jgi:hypothetical protein
MSIRDRASVVADALVAELVITLTTIARTELKRRITEILRDELADERETKVVS